MKKIIFALSFLLVANLSFGQWATQSTWFDFLGFNKFTGPVRLPTDTAISGISGSYGSKTGHPYFRGVSKWDRIALLSEAGSGVPNSNIGSGYRFAVPGTNNVKTFHPGLNIIIDSTTNSNELTAHADTTTGTTKLATQGDIDRFFAALGLNEIVRNGNLTDTSIGAQWFHVVIPEQGNSAAITFTHVDITGNPDLLRGLIQIVGGTTAHPYYVQLFAGGIGGDSLNANRNQFFPNEDGMLSTREWNRTHINYAKTFFTPTEAGTVSLVSYQYNIINPAGPLTDLTLNLPDDPTGDGTTNNTVIIKFLQGVANLICTQCAPGSIPTSVTAGQMITLVFDLSEDLWY